MIRFNYRRYRNLRRAASAPEQAAGTSPAPDSPHPPPPGCLAYVLFFLVGAITFISFIKPEILIRPIALVFPAKEADPAARHRASPAGGPEFALPPPAQDGEPASLTLILDPLPERLIWDGAELPPESPMVISPIRAEVPHLLRLEDPGSEAHEQRVVLSPGENLTLRLALKPLPAMVDLTSRPAGAVLRIDGNYDGRKTPIHSLRFSPGTTYQLELEKKGYRTWRLSFEARPGSRETLEAALEPIRGGLFVDSKPWVDVFLGQEHLGRTPYRSNDIPAGKHQLRLINEGRSVFHEETILIAEGATITKRYAFEGALDFSAIPAGWTVTLDGRPLGQTPLGPVRLPAGTYELGLRAGAADHEQRAQIRVLPNKRSRVTLR